MNRAVWDNTQAANQPQMCYASRYPGCYWHKSYRHDSSKKRKPEDRISMFRKIRLAQPITTPAMPFKEISPKEPTSGVLAAELSSIWEQICGESDGLPHLEDAHVNYSGSFLLPPRKRSDWPIMVHIDQIITHLYRVTDPYDVFVEESVGYIAPSLIIELGLYNDHMSQVPTFVGIEVKRDGGILENALHQIVVWLSLK